ncbi:unnamed protein product [Echinostoma caproni]|uniref:Uncharacterized protein n=1 Tax=Echinostoma caproni TaxID=27848 RepID=A0A3P8KQV8_9TREM|nr:unnamed protein product [Echinostoma caproni]
MMNSTKPFELLLLLLLCAFCKHLCSHCELSHPL